MWLLKTIWWSIARRLFGNGDFKKKVSRTIQVIILILVLTLDLTTSWTYKDLGIALAVSTWVIIQYWSRSVGEIIDAGLNPCQGRKNYDRWFRVVCNWITAFINLFLPEGKKIHKYYGVYDWIYSSMRNLVGILPCLFLYPSWMWWILVFCMYPIYRFCYWLFEKCPKLYEMPLTLNEPKNVAEILHGAVFGLIVGLV